MARFSPHFPSSGRKSAAREIEIGEREEREHLCTVFGDAAIADLAIAELAFDDAKHVFDLRAHFAEAAVASALPLREIAARLRFFFHGPQNAGAFRRPVVELWGLRLLPQLVIASVVSPTGTSDALAAGRASLLDIAWRP